MQLQAPPQAQKRLPAPHPSSTVTAPLPTVRPRPSPSCGFTVQSPGHSLLRRNVKHMLAFNPRSHGIPGPCSVSERDPRAAPAAGGVSQYPSSYPAEAHLHTSYILGRQRSLPLHLQSRGCTQACAGSCLTVFPPFPQHTWNMTVCKDIPRKRTLP